MTLAQEPARSEEADAQARIVAEHPAAFRGGQPMTRMETAMRAAFQDTMQRPHRPEYLRSFRASEIIPLPRGPRRLVPPYGPTVLGVAADAPPHVLAQWLEAP